MTDLDFSEILNNQSDELFDENLLAKQLEKFMNDINDIENNTSAIQTHNIQLFANDNSVENNDTISKTINRTSDVNSSVNESILINSDVKHKPMPAKNNCAVDSVYHNHTYLETARSSSVEDIYHPHSYKNKMKNIFSANERMSKDEKMLNDHKIKYSLERIVNSEVDDFSEILKDTELNAEQIAVLKDIRKRGKNKVCSISTIVSQST